jgi:hypothetical protein
LKNNSLKVNSISLPIREEGKNVKEQNRSLRSIFSALNLPPLAIAGEKIALMKVHSMKSVKENISSN